MRLSRSMSDDVDRKVRQFLLGGNVHRELDSLGASGVNYEPVKTGYWIIHYAGLESDVLTKLRWRLTMAPEALWARVLCFKYCKELDIYTSKIKL